MWGDTSCVALDHLRTADGEQATEAAITDPAHWAVTLYEEDGYADAETGEIVAGELIDWSTEDDPEAQPQQGFRHANSVVDKTIYVPEYFCTDYQAAGLQLSPSILPPGGRPASDTATDPDASDEDKARAAAEAEAACADALRRDRRKVIALNRLGDAAMHVRRDFVRKLLARPTQGSGDLHRDLPNPRARADQRLPRGSGRHRSAWNREQFDTGEAGEGSAADRRRPCPGHHLGSLRRGLPTSL